MFVVPKQAPRTVGIFSWLIPPLIKLNLCGLCSKGKSAGSGKQAKESQTVAVTLNWGCYYKLWLCSQRQRAGQALGSQRSLSSCNVLLLKPPRRDRPRLPPPARAPRGRRTQRLLDGRGRPLAAARAGRSRSVLARRLAGACGRASGPRGAGEESPGERPWAPGGQAWRHSRGRGGGAGDRRFCSRKPQPRVRRWPGGQGRGGRRGCARPRSRSYGSVGCGDK